MAIPAKVAQQGEEADRQLDEFVKARSSQEPAVETEGSGTTEVPAPAAPAEPVNEPAPPERPVEGAQVEGELSLQARYDALKKAYGLEKQRNETLQGKYNAEVPRLTKAIRELQTEFKTMQDAQPRQPEKPPHMRHVKEEELTGADMETVDLNARMARGEAEAVGDRIRAEVKAELGPVIQELEQSRLQLMWDQVERAHPGAAEMDRTDPNWIKFLADTDELTGETYEQIGMRALEAHDARRIVKLIDTYKATVASIDGRVERQTKPATIRGDASHVRGPQKRVYKESELKKLTSEITKGIWRGREKEAQKLQDEMETAAMEGRFILGQ